MKKTAIEVTDEQMRQKGEECSTFSGEYWRSMTPAQQAALVEIRERKISSTAYTVAKNEEEAGIRYKMDDLRKQKSASDEAVRDLYFSIPDVTARIRAINDLYYYESARRSHDEAMVLEAYYRYEDVQRNLLFGWVEWPGFKKLIFRVAIIDVIALLIRLVWPSIKDSVDWFVGLSVAFLFAYGVYLQMQLRLLESRYFLLWEIEKLRRGVNDHKLEPQPRRYELFGENERQSGIRSVPREVPW